MGIHDLPEPSSFEELTTAEAAGKAIATGVSAAVGAPELGQLVEGVVVTAFASKSVRATSAAAELIGHERHAAGHADLHRAAADLDRRGSPEQCAVR